MTGVGIVDLMVGLTISLIAMLVILKVAILFEARRNSTVGMADAQLNASSAMTLISRDIRMAGQGLGPPDSLGCAVDHDLSALVAPLTLKPVEIMDGAQGESDSILVLSSATPQIMTPATLIADHATGDTSLMLDSTLGIQRDHLLLLYEPSKDCSLFQATSIPIGGYRVDHATPVRATKTAYQVGARAINLGGMYYVRYAINDNLQLQRERYNAADNAWSAAVMASEVVNLQAQYGFDLRPGPQASPQVTRWSSTMLNADGSGTTGDNGDLLRLLAIRLAIVVRSVQRSDQGCHSPNPQWMAADGTTGELKATDIIVDKTPDWACYRYRVLQTEIPLRNLLWSDS